MAARDPDDDLSEAMAAASVTSRGRLNLPYYKMDAVPRGICVIINNHSFYRESKASAESLDEREGTHVDRDKLKATFERLKFVVQCYEDQTDTDILQVIQRLAVHDHSNYDCFVCCVLSHGDLGVVYGSNGVPVKIKDLTKNLRPQFCPTLTGKPKLFFLQACQGKGRQEGHVELQADAKERDRLRLIPNEADFLVSYATVPGYVSWRNTREGSWFIGKLTELLDNYGHE
nr:hypothetical protein BaRGS_002282 [Batillaria attramentaria]